LAYLLGFITGMLFLAIEPYKYDPFVGFHAFQSIFLSCFCFVFFMGWSMLIRITFGIGFLWTMLALLVYLLRLAYILLNFFLIYKAFRYQRFSLPVIGPLAAKWAG
jgi:uncharacterized membrane protein